MQGGRFELDNNTDRNMNSYRKFSNIKNKTNILY